jgi:cell division protein FtsI/penicillin-binding protein 2
LFAQFTRVATGLVGFLCFGLFLGHKPLVAQQAVSPTADTPRRPEIPPTLPTWDDSEVAHLEGQDLTISATLQNHLKNYIKYRNNPIAAVMLVSVRTGEVLAMVQGQSPEKWQGTTHTALHNGFPAASLFKTVVASAAIEIGDLDPEAPMSLVGGCSKVHARGAWMRFDVHGRRYRLSLRRAYGRSCNGFFAKLAVNEIGYGPILSFARRFGWNGQQIGADFLIPPSPLREPDPKASSVHTIGKFAAGFGYVGLSVAHASWQMLALANNGQTKPLKLFKSSADEKRKSAPGPVVSTPTAQRMLKMMDATVLGGTATSAFRSGKYRRIRYDVGGKTGTLSGDFPEGLTTWFAGIYPLEKPEVVVAAVTVLEELWQFKAANLAAEALISYKQWQQRRTSALKRPGSQVSKN